MALELPRNALKRALKEGRSQIGLWCGISDPCVAELLAASGFDVLVFDTEHAANDTRSVLALLQAVSSYAVHPAVRLVSGSTAVIKQYLDLGVQTIIVPMIETEAQAADVVAATRYPPRGTRGVATATTRAARFTRIPRYLERADAEISVWVQVESVRGLGNLQTIAQVEGVDGVFFGPADLAASMGLAGQLDNHPLVHEALLRGIDTVRAAGKGAGTLTLDRARGRIYLERGATFMAMGVDMTLLARAASDLAAAFGGDGDTAGDAAHDAPRAPSGAPSRP
jgi:4-hydroxy-2-oxoheptanedioate aldolase